MANLEPHLCFPEGAPYVVSNCTACPTSSELAFYDRYGCRKGGNANAANQRQNQPKAPPDPDVARDLAFGLLRNVITKTPANKSEKVAMCKNKLRPLVSEDFTLNNTPGADEGLMNLCSYMTGLRHAFPEMDVALNYFRDKPTHNAFFILFVLGKMTGKWRNHNATNEFEHLGVTMQFKLNQDYSKVVKCDFRSEMLSGECYHKVRSLDLIHTAFKEIHKQRNIPKPPEEAAPFVLAAATHKNVPRNVPKSVPKNLLQNALKNVPKNNKYERRLLEAEAAANKNAEFEDDPEVEEAEEPEENTNENGDNDTDEDTDENENNEDNENENQGGNNSNVSVGSVTRSLMRQLEEKQNKLHQLNQSAGGGGDGYYVAVEQVPVAGQPVYQGYSSCCPPYFTTDGSQYDGLSLFDVAPEMYSLYPDSMQGCSVTGQAGGSHTNKSGKNKVMVSRTVTLVENGVVKSMTESVMEGMTDQVAKAIAEGDPEVMRRVRRHMHKHMGHHVSGVVKNAVQHASKRLSRKLPKHKKDERLVVLPIEIMQGKRGGALGTLGTLLFPGGLSPGIAAWLLTLGASVSDRIDGQLYGPEHVKRRRRRKSVGKKRKRRSTRKGQVRKTARRAYTGLKKKKRRRRSTSAKKKPRRRRSTSKKRSKSKPQRKTRKVKKKATASKRKRWRPLSNAEIRRLMRKQKGGNCYANICGDASLNPFDGCQRPMWGPRCM